MKKTEHPLDPSKKSESNSEEPSPRSILWVPWKGSYITGPKPPVKCILCAAKNKDPKVKIFEIFRNADFLVLLNLYPYNPGHILIVPIRHIENIEDLTENENRELMRLIQQVILLLKRVYNPHGFNIGFNIGRSSGASISHLHAHVVPRFFGDQGFMETIGDVRVIVEDLQTTLEKLKPHISILKKNKVPKTK